MTIFESVVAVLEFLNFTSIGKTQAQSTTTNFPLRKKEKVFAAIFLVALLGGLFLHKWM